MYETGLNFIPGDELEEILANNEEIDQR